MMHGLEKSDPSIVAAKPTNKAGMLAAELVEPREGAEGNTHQQRTRRAQDRESVSQVLARVRKAARSRKTERFTSLLHHLNPAMLRTAFFALNRDAAVGVDGLTWRSDEADLDRRIDDLHWRVQRGAYWAQPARRRFIPKPDGRQRPLAIAALEDKIVQRATVAVLNAIYEVDFLGFSYGFRPGRGQHDALDALCVGISGTKVNYILDADVRSFFDEVSPDWLVKFLKHRIADPRVLRLIQKWLKAGILEGGKVEVSGKGTPQGAVISPLLANVYLHYAFDLWADRWRRQATGNVVIVRYADDIIVGFEHEADAVRFREALEARLASFSLTLHPDKTRLGATININERPSVRVIIVGAGIMGLAAAWALDRTGHTVEVYDQGPIPNSLSSSHDEHRLIRRAYGEMEPYGRLIPDAYAAWDQLWGDLGQRLYVETGLLAIDSDDGGTWAESSRRALGATDRPGRWLSAAEVGAAFPLLSVEGIRGALHHGEGGVLLAAAILTALADRLRRSPRVTLHPQCAVRDVDPERGRIVLTNGGPREADAVLVAAGAWVTRLLPALTRRLTPSRQLVVYLSPPASEHERWTRSPMLVDLSRSLGFYLVPPVAGRGLKVGDHRFSLSGDPDEDRTALEYEAEALLAGCRRRLKTFEAWTRGQAKVCYYTVEPDERFVVEALGARGWLASACSGHAFKFAALMGRHLAAAVTGSQAGLVSWPPSQLHEAAE